MAMAGMDQNKLNNNINVTPLADVMLVLLIIFMVVTPMLQKGVDVKLPEAEYAADHPDNQDTVTVAIDRQSQVYLDMLPVPQTELTTKLSEKFETKAERVLFLKADESLEYRDVLEVMDLCRDGGADEIGLITDVKVQS